MSDENLDKDKAREAGGGQPKPPEPLTPDQQKKIDEAAEARQAATAGGPEAGLVDLGTPSATPTGPETGQPSWEQQSYPGDKGEYNPDHDPMVQRAKTDANPEKFLEKPMGPQARATIEQIVRDREAGIPPELPAETAASADIAGGGEPPEASGVAAAGSEDGEVGNEEANGHTGLTSEADDLLRTVDEGDVPAFVTSNLERIAHENDVDTKGKTPEQIVDELRSKRSVSPGVETLDAGGSDVAEELPTPEPEVAASGSEPEAPKPEPEPTPSPGPKPEGSDTREPKIKPETEEEKYRAMWERKSPEARHKQAEKLRRDIARAEKKMDRLDTLADQDALDERIDSMKDQLDIIEDVQAGEKDPKFPSAVKGETANEEDFGATLDAEIADYKKLAGKTFEGLGDELVSEENTLQGLQARLAKAKGPEKDEIQRRINAAEARIDVIQGFRIEKEKEYLKGKNEEAILEAEKRRRELGDIPAIQKGINENRPQIEKLDKDILALEEKINKAVEGSDEWRQLNGQKLELSKQANKLREKLRLDEEALKVAEEKARKETGSGDTPTLENIDQKSVEEYLALAPDKRKDHLRAVSEVLPSGKYNFDAVNGKATRGEPLSIEERAFLANEITNRLLKEKKAGSYDAKELAKLAHKYPEVYGLVTDKIMTSKAAEAFRRENFPRGWENLIDFVKKHPELMSILIALILGTGAAIVGPATSIAGVSSMMMR